jgi:2-polyprenyl-3-methyl-5-hydroxy-6-metoxy-1,4-benzoquinol methylase
MIRDDGWLKYCIWEHSAIVKDLYARRCRLEAEEMTCAAQAAELLTPLVTPGDTLLDVGCGSGYFFHSLKKRGIPAEYYGIDGAPSLIEIGRTHLPAHGLPPERLRVLRIEDLEGEADHVLCMNVLTNLDNYHRPLERILKCARKSVILRESSKETTEYAYVRDDYLDECVDLKVHVNSYGLSEFMDFMASYGFKVTNLLDRRSQGRAEVIIGYPHYWTFFIAQRSCQR